MSQIIALPPFFIFLISLTEKKCLYVMLSMIWYHLYNLKRVKNTHGGALLLVKLQRITYLYKVANSATHHISLQN